MLRNHILPQPEVIRAVMWKIVHVVIRAVMLGDSPHALHTQQSTDLSSVWKIRV